MKVEHGTVVTYDYVIRDPMGTVVESTFPDRPFAYLHGVTPVLACVAEHLEGRQAGASLRFTARPAEFGRRDPNAVRVIPRGDWPADAEPTVGATATLTWAGSAFTGRVVSADHAHVTVDLNSPYAGVTLEFAVELRHVRAATPTELERGGVLSFPFDVLAHREFPGSVGEALVQLGPHCMVPPYPWGQWLYGRLLTEHCAKLEGDVIELGVGLGGTSVFFAYLAGGRRVYALDSFEGLPAPDPNLDNPYFLPELYKGRTPLLARFRQLVAERDLSASIVPIAGWFSDSLPTLSPDQRFCLAHLDSDLYSSVTDSLNGVWDRLVDGGVLIIDDFFHPAQGPARACADFFNRRGERPLYRVVFPYSVAVIKGEAAPHRGQRSLDGNTYSLAWLRADAVLRATTEASAARAAPGTRVHANAVRFLDLLTAQTERTSDIYAYWSALEDFWETIAAGFSQVEPI